MILYLASFYRMPSLWSDILGLDIFRMNDLLTSCPGFICMQWKVVDFGVLISNMLSGDLRMGDKKCSSCNCGLWGLALLRLCWSSASSRENAIWSLVWVLIDWISIKKGFQTFLGEGKEGWENFLWVGKLLQFTHMVGLASNHLNMNKIEN